MAATFIFNISPIDASTTFSGNLNGIIIDAETNKPVSNAAVELLNNNRFTTSNSEGIFTFTNVIEGTYTLKVTHLGYKETLASLKFDEGSTAKFAVYILPKAIEISTVIVSDKPTLSKFEDLYELSNVLKGKELQKDLGITLASTLKNETGIAIRSMGPAPSRPVIRGLGGDRVMISEDGEKIIDLSATSPDHAVTVEPFSIDRIEVIRGPKLLTFTPVSIGGVVNVVRNEIPIQIHNAPFGTIGGFYESANNGYIGSLITEVPYDKFALRFEGSRKRTEDLSTPEGKLKNSGSSNTNLTIGGSFIDNDLRIGSSFRRFELDYGVPGGFVGAHPNGVNITLYKNQFRFLTDINFENSFISELEISYGTSLYRHKEFEKSGKIGSEFRIFNHSLSVDARHSRLGILDNGTFGLSGEMRDFDIGGFVFTSPTRSYNLALFGFETFTLDRFTFETGLRFNYDLIKPEREKAVSNIGYIRQRTFYTYSASVSVLYELTKIVHIGANISKSSRVPTIEELFSEGPHLAAYSYETGNPDLTAEGGFGTEIFIYHKFTNLFYNINLFYNNIAGYIIPRNKGRTNFATFLPIYATSGIDAVLYGLELQADWKLLEKLSFGFSTSYTLGSFKDDGKPLPQIPPLKGLIELKYESETMTAGISNEYAFSQNRVDQFEEPTDGYTVFNLFFQYSINAAHLIHSFSLNVHNIFNRIYRNHLSRVKLILPEAGINARITYKLFFHL
ncbi:MAG: TonB-dependent receptor [Ignavibacteria bacterium]|nr:TonB-dependent receptor [Ignavibacteria bacterium]